MSETNPMAGVLEMTEMEKQEFRLARLHLRDALSKALTDVESAIDESRKTGDIITFKDLMGLLAGEPLRQSFSEASKPMRAALERKQRETA